MRFLVPWPLVLLAACSRTPAVTPQAFQPSDVAELGAPPLGYSAGKTLRASCSSVRTRTFGDEALGNVDCSTARLSRVLRARAGELGARFIVGKRCHARGGERTELACTADVAYPSERVALEPGAARDAGPAPSAEQVLDLDEPRPQDADLIYVGFVPIASSQRRSLAPRSYDAVAETRVASVGPGVLGQVSARCAGCEPSALRHALRVAAGRVGAGEVTAVKCFQDEGAVRCIATALVPWKLLIVRHGESVANAEGRMQGQRDYPLSEAGIGQARLLGRFLVQAGFRFDAAYTSPLTRARSTALELTTALGMPEAELAPELSELHAGSLQGLTRDEIVESFPGFMQRGLTGLGDFSEYGGESYEGVQLRVRSLVARWQERHQEAAHRLLAVAHGGTNFHLVKALICAPVPRVMSLKFGNCTATLVRMRERRGEYLGELVFHLPIDVLGATVGEGLVGIF